MGARQVERHYKTLSLSTQELCSKKVGLQPEIDEVLTFVTPVVQHHYTVTGVIREVPRNSHFRFDILASYIAEQRTKEVGIRKVLGASVANIVLLFTKDFVKPVMLANLLAWPVAYYAMSGWLHNFAYRIDLSIGFFILSGMLTLIIALMTVGWQAVRTAGTNPVDSLRSE